MSTARHIITRAFSKIGVRAAETPLSAAEISDGLFSLNDLLNTWNSTGTLKGVDPVVDVDLDLQEPDYSTWALITNLAMILVGEYGVPLSQTLPGEAMMSKSAMITASIDLSNVAYPGTLPLGSGNRDGFSTGLEREFFPENNKRNF